jgi:hypothetical protein
MVLPLISEKLAFRQDSAGLAPHFVRSGLTARAVDSSRAGG